MRHKGGAAARHLFELCADNPEMMRRAAEAFAEIAEIFTRWKERAREGQRPGHRPALMHAVMRNDPEKIAALIKAGVWLDETDEGETALHWAVSRQHTEIVTMLLDAGANPNVPDNDGYTPLHDVAEMGDCPPARTMLEALLAAGADPAAGDRFGRTALLEAARGGRLAVLDRLLAQLPKGGAHEAAAVDAHGRSALMLAAMSENATPALIERLLPIGA
jgi:ankyrin repeat protein